MRRPVDPEKAYHLINHGPCNLITTGDGTRRNVAPINWTMPVLDDPPLVASAIEHDILTHELVKKTGEFCVNLVGENLAEKVLFCGRTSGYEVDKFARTGLTPVPCEKIRPPRIAQSPAHLECVVEKSLELEGLTLFIARIVWASAEEEVYDGKTLQVEKVKTIHHLGGGEFAVTERRIRIPKPPRP